MQDSLMTNYNKILKMIETAKSLNNKYENIIKNDKLSLLSLSPQNEQ